MILALAQGWTRLTPVDPVVQQLPQGACSPDVCPRTQLVSDALVGSRRRDVLLVEEYLEAMQRRAWALSRRGVVQEVAHNQEVADREALQQEVQRLFTHIVALWARVDTPAGARPGGTSVADYIKQITPRSTEELMEQQSRETGNREPPA